MNKKTSSLLPVVYVESKYILGNSIGKEAIPRLVRYLEIRNTIISLVKTCWVLETWGGTNKELQLDIARLFLPTNFTKAVDLLSDTEKIIFFQPQVLVLMKYLILYGRETETRNNLNEDDRRKIGLALLGITDGISHLYHQEKKERGDLDPLSDVAIELVTASFYIKNPRIGLSLTRATHLYINIHRKIAKNKTENFVDIEKIFSEAVGLSLEDYLVIGMGLLVEYIQNWKPGEYPDPKFIFLRPKKYFANAKIDQIIIEKMIDFISMDSVFLRNSVEKQTERQIYYDFIDFRIYPLLQLGQDLYIPLSVQFLSERVTMGIYWIIFDYLRNKNEELHNRFMRYHGEIFQEYVQDIISAINSREFNRLDIVVDKPYKVNKLEYRTSDLLLFGEDFMICVEVSATRLQAKRTMSLGDTNAFHDDFEKMIMHNTRSLDTFIRNFQDGYVNIDGVDSSKIKKIFPVIVTIEGLPKHQVLSLFINREIEKENLLKMNGIEELFIIDVEDLEELEGFSDLSFIETLEKWQNSPYFHHSSMRDFLKITAQPKKEKSSWLDNIRIQIFNEATMRIFGKPLNEVKE